MQNSYSDSNRNFEGVEMVEDSKEQGIHGSRSQDDSNVTREPIWWMFFLVIWYNFDYGRRFKVFKRINFNFVMN